MSCDNGSVGVTPSALRLSSDVWAVFSVLGSIAHGILPVAGGYLDQSASGMQAIGLARATLDELRASA